jgi:predicted ester cyclase
VRGRSGSAPEDQRQTIEAVRLSSELPGPQLSSFNPEEWIMTGTTLRALAGMAICASIAIGCKSSEKPKDGAEPMAQTTTAAADSSSTVGQKNIALSKEFMAKVFEQGDTTVIDTHVSPDFVDHNPAPGQAPGIAGFKKAIMEWRTAFPDTKIAIEDIFANGDKVVIRSIQTGTQTGELGGMKATGKPIKVEAIDIVRIVDGKMVEHWGQIDSYGMMQQMGMIPSSGK